MVHRQLGVDPAGPVDLAVVVVDLADLLQKPRVCECAIGRGAGGPVVKSGAADPEQLAGDGDGDVVLGLLRRDHSIDRHR